MMSRSSCELYSFVCFSVLFVVFLSVGCVNDSCESELDDDGRPLLSVEESTPIHERNDNAFRLPQVDMRKRAVYVLEFFKNLTKIETLQDLVSIEGVGDLMKGARISNAMQLKLQDSIDDEEMYRYVVIIQPDYLVAHQSAVYVVVDRRIDDDQLTRICSGNVDGTQFSVHRIIVRDRDFPPE